MELKEVGVGGALTVSMSTGHRKLNVPKSFNRAVGGLISDML